MDIEKVRQTQSQDELRDYAIQWQHWISEENLSLDELLEWQQVFEYLAEKFDLTEEFTENGII